MFETPAWAVLPHVCILCQAICQKYDLCASCAHTLPYCEINCQRCGLTLLNEAALVSKVPNCGACIKNPPPYDTTLALFEYKSPIDQLIRGLKFHEKLIYARALGELMAGYLAKYYQNQPLPDVIIPVPLHKKRLQERGYNQALELARPLAKQLGLPLLTRICQRHHATRTQSSLSLAKRRQNIKGAFSLSKEEVGKHIVIIDDVITSAGTVTEISQLFKQAGVEKITLWCLARSNRD